MNGRYRPPHPISRVPGPRPPGSPPFGAPPRLPSLDGVNAYQPPPPAPLPPPPAPTPDVVKPGGYEAEQVTMLLPTATEIILYTTTRRWRAIEVYCQPRQANMLAAANFFSVGIYAKVRGARFLVGSGRYGDINDNAGTSFKIAQARASLAEVFEVTLAFAGIPAAPADTVPFDFFVVASDECGDDPDEMVGAIPLRTNLISSAVSIGYAADAIPFELCAVHGAAPEGAAAALFVQVHDRAAAVVNGNAPQLSFAVAGGAGSLILPSTLAGPRELRGQRFRSGVFVCGSSTMATATLASAGFQAWVR